MSSSPLIWISSTPTSTWEHKAVQQRTAQPVNLRLTGQRMQTVRGFGGCFNELGWQALSWLTPEQRQSALANLFDPQDGCAFTFCRIPIGASDFALDWYSLNEVTGDYGMEKFSIERDRQMLIPYIRAAQAIQPNLTFFASPWSPPTWMKNPPVYNYGRLSDDERTLSAYALYMVKFVQAYRAEGIPVVQIHPQNEVVADQKFSSCVWKPELLAKFIREYLGPLFERSDSDCDIWLGTINSGDYNAWAASILGCNENQRYIKGIGFQYDGKHAIQRAHMAFPETELLMTESESGSSANSWTEALYQYELMHHYFLNGVSGYIYWNMALPDGGLSTWGWPQNSLLTVTPAGELIYQPEYYLMKHFSAFVKPGATLLGVTGPWAGNALVFENPDGGKIVLVANTQEIVRLFTFDGFSADLPPQSINTILLKN